MFNTIYQRTDASELQVESMLQKLGFNIPVGVYNNGLLMVLDIQNSKEIMADWDWLFKERCIALITTGIGNVFLLKESTGEIFHMDVQSGKPEFIDLEVDWFINEFLVKPQIIESVIWRERIEKLISYNRPLKYHEAFILEPWIILGGQEKIENYKIGACDVYLSLVGQTNEQVNTR